jgi:RHS repeat-associated protein
MGDPVTYSYKVGGKIGSVTDPSNRVVTNTRNALGKIAEVTASGIQTPLATGLTYRPFGGPLGLTNGSGGVVSNQAGECDCVTVSNPGQPRERTYGYDANRNLTSITGTNTPQYSQAFEYDELNRLVGATGRYGSIAYTYDDVGNRLTRNMNGTTETCTYVTGTNRINQITGGLNPRTFSYDANGNITGDGTLTFTYDQNNQLKEVKEGANTIATYTYNGLGQRMKKVVGGVTTVYHYDMDGKLIAESTLGGTTTKEYLYMGKVRVAMVDVAGGNVLYVYHNARLGTPEILTNATATVAWEAWYEPFGEAHIHPSSSVTNNIRLPGQYFDQETRLHYNYHRYYDPKTGRYLTPDPLHLGAIQIAKQSLRSKIFALALYQEGLSSPEVLNLYLYAVNNPLNTIDQYGMFVGSLLAKGAAKIVGGQSAEEAGFIAGKLADSSIGMVLGLDPDVVPDSVKKAVGSGVLAIQGWGVVQTGSLAILTAGAAPVVPLAFAGAAGAEAGLFFNAVWEYFSGQPLGADIYDWLHPAISRSPCE